MVVVVSRLDRFGRSVLERARSAEELRSLRVPIHSVTEGGLLPDLVANLLAAVAEEEVRRMRERSAETRRFVTDAGWHYPTRPAWGYRRRLATASERAEGAPHTVLAVDVKRARYVREAFRRVAAGQSVSSIMIWIQRLSVDARGGRSMSYPLVRALLSRPVYVARNVSGNPEVLDRPMMRWRPLVSDELWSLVQAQLAKVSASPDVWRPRYLLAGFIRCGKCGARMGGTQNRTLCKRGYNVQPRYACAGRVGGVGGRSAHCYETALMPVMDSFVTRAVSELLLNHTCPDRSEPDGATMFTTGPQMPRMTSAESAIARSGLLRLTLRLLDGRVSATAYKRARRKLVYESPAVADSKAGAATAREQLARASRSPRSGRWLWRVKTANDNE